jgi:toxin FitB
MNLLDSNIVIYAGQSPFQWLKQLLQPLPCAVSVATKIEVLGYHWLTPDDKADLETFFAAHLILETTLAIADRAVALRQQKKMSLGDATIAATALEHGFQLVTRNTTDFGWIAGLKLWNPFDQQASP